VLAAEFALLRLVAEEGSLRATSLLELEMSEDPTLNGESEDIRSTGKEGLLPRDVLACAFNGLGGSPGFQYRYSFLTCARTVAM
jgi:hypothetical protein